MEKKVKCEQKMTVMTVKGYHKSSSVVKEEIFSDGIVAAAQIIRIYSKYTRVDRDLYETWSSNFAIKINIGLVGRL